MVGGRGAVWSRVDNYSDACDLSSTNSVLCCHWGQHCLAFCSLTAVNALEKSWLYCEGDQVLSSVNHPPHTYELKPSGFLSGPVLRDWSLFCCSLTSPELCVAVSRVTFLSCPALICNSSWVMPWRLTSAWDLRLWLYCSVSVSFLKLCGVALGCCSALHWVSLEGFGGGQLQCWPLRRLASSRGSTAGHS